MHSQIYIIAGGAASFLILFWVDYFDIKKLRLPKILTWIFGLTSLSFFHVLAVYFSDKINYSLFLKSAGWLFFILFFMLLLYSVFIELYILKKLGYATGNGELVSTGTYAMCRHPGIIWYVLMLISLFFATGARSLLWAIPVWGGMDFLYALIQDIYFFPKIFGEDYLNYKKSTPMIMPTLSSIKACLAGYKKLLKSY